MAVKIKLKRLGKIRAPQYRVVIADARNKRDGRSIEEIGLYHPMQQPSLIEIDSERAQYWLGVGAQPTEAVLALLKVTGDWQKFKGLPGAEGTLQVAKEKTDRKAVFAAAAAEAAGLKGSDATTAKKKAPKAEQTPVDEVPVTAEPADQPTAVATPEAPATASANQAAENAETPQADA
ncbi:MAG: 30S ribosomal protein S16 [Candidatus Nanopelagicales bacterium]